MSYEKEYRHCLENTNKRELVDKIIYDEKEFIKKDKEIERLNKENEKLKEKIYKARKMIFDNYGVLDKYEIELLDDILKEVE